MANEITAKEQFEFVFRAFQGLQTVQVISLGLQLGMIAVINDSDGGITHTELAHKLGLHEPYVRVWCETGYALGVLNLTPEGRYVLPPKMDTVLLDADHPRFLGGFAEGFSTFLAEDFQRYQKAFRDGSVHPFWEHGEAFSDWVSSLTHPMQRLVVGRLLPELFPQLIDGAEVLDIGCGTGRLVFKLAEAYPNCRFVGVDVDAHGIKIARAQAKQLGLGERVAFHHLDGDQAISFENAFDLALMFEVFHELPVFVRPGVLAGCHKALRPGGRLFIVDETWPDHPADLRDPAYNFSVLVQFSELIWGNVVATENEQNRLLAEAGFVDLQRGDLGGTFTTIVAAKK